MEKSETPPPSDVWWNLEVSPIMIFEWSLTETWWNAMCDGMTSLVKKREWEDMPYNSYLLLISIREENVTYITKHPLVLSIPLLVYSKFIICTIPMLMTSTYQKYTFEYV